MAEIVLRKVISIQQKMQFVDVKCENKCSSVLSVRKSGKKTDITGKTAFCIKRDKCSQVFLSGHPKRPVGPGKMERLRRENANEH